MPGSILESKPSSELELWLEKHAMQGLLGKYHEGCRCKVEYKVIKEDDKTITLVTCLYGLITDEGRLLCINRTDGTILSNAPVTLTQEELEQIFQDLNLGSPDHIDRSGRKRTEINTMENRLVCAKDKLFRVRLTSHLRHRPIDVLIKHINMAQDLPIARDYPTNHRVVDLFKVQIVSHSLGLYDFFYENSLEGRVKVVERLARVFQTFWDAELDRKIGIMNISGDPVSISIGSERPNGLDAHFGAPLTGPYSSVAEFLTEWIRHFLLDKLEKGECHLGSQWCSNTRHQIEGGFEIPPEVEEVPIVISPKMSLSSMIFNQNEPHDLEEIDLGDNFIDALPFASVLKYIEPLFRDDASGTENLHGSSKKLRDAFWNEIPKWKKHLNSEATGSFLDWYSLGLRICENPALEREREAWGPMFQEMEDLQKKHKTGSSYISRFSSERLDNVQALKRSCQQHSALKDDLTT